MKTPIEFWLVSPYAVPAEHSALESNFVVANPFRQENIETYRRRDRTILVVCTFLVVGAECDWPEPGFAGCPARVLCPPSGRQPDHDALVVVWSGRDQARVAERARADESRWHRRCRDYDALPARSGRSVDGIP